MKRLPTVPVPIPSKLYYGWIIVAVAFLMNMVASPTNPVMFSFFVAPMSEDLGLSRSSLSWMLTVRLAVASFSGPILGVIVDRYGTRWTGVVAALLGAICLIGLSRVTGLGMLLTLAAISGLAGFGSPAGALLTVVPVAKWFQAKRGRALAITMIGISLGTTLYIPFASWLIISYSWRTAWLVFGIIMAAVAVPMFALFMRRQPEDLGLEVDGGRVEMTAKQAKQRRAYVTTHDWTLGQAMRTPAMWLMIGAMVCAGMVLQGTLVYRVAFWRDIGMSPSLIALGTALDPFTLIFSGLAFGVIAERVHTRYLGMIGGFIFAATLLPMIFATNNAFYILAHNILWGLGAGAFITTNNVMLPNYFGRKYLGTIRGVVLPVSIGSSAIGAPLFGYLLDSSLNPRVVWMGSLVAFVLAGIFLFLAKPPTMKAKLAVPQAT